MKTVIVGLISFCLVAAGVIGGYLKYHDSQKSKYAVCWSEQTKQSISDLSTRIVRERIESIVRKDGTEITDEKRKRIAQFTTLKLSNFHVISSDLDVDRFTCGMSVKFTFQNQNKPVISGETSSQFDIFKGESGQVYSILSVSLVTLVDIAN